MDPILAALKESRRDAIQITPVEKDGKKGYSFTFLRGFNPTYSFMSEDDARIWYRDVYLKGQMQNLGGGGLLRGNIGPGYRGVGGSGRDGTSPGMYVPKPPPSGFAAGGGQRLPKGKPDFSAPEHRYMLGLVDSLVTTYEAAKGFLEEAAAATDFEIFLARKLKDGCAALPSLPGQIISQAATDFANDPVKASGKYSGEVLQGAGFAKLFKWALAQKLPKPLVIDSKQLGQKMGPHAGEFGLDVTKPADRIRFRQIVEDIGNNPDRTVSGTWAGMGGSAPGGRGPAEFRIKGDDVVVASPNGDFVTILKDGVKQNPSVRQALGLPPP
jgi:hypothetical protein